MVDKYCTVLWMKDWIEDTAGLPTTTHSSRRSIVVACGGGFVAVLLETRPETYRNHEPLALPSTWSKFTGEQQGRLS